MNALSGSHPPEYRPQGRNVLRIEGHKEVIYRRCLNAAVANHLAEELNKGE